MKTALFGLFALTLPALAIAAPELKGTRGELTHYLLDERKIVSIFGEGEHKAQADTAIVSLAVSTKQSKLNKALEENKTLRLDIEKRLIEKGIAKENIKASKFSSTPNYGWFGKAPSSYEVNNEIKVTISDEQQMVEIAKIIDSMKEVSLLSTEYEQSAEQKHELTALRKSMKEIEAKKSLYEKSLNITLTPIKIIDQNVIARPVPMLHRKAARMESMVSGIAPEMGMVSEGPSDFGEMTYTARTRVEFIVSEK